MNEQHAKGAADKVAGKIKEFAGPPATRNLKPKAKLIR
jgi:uncharacterized protein YjbJ (UPF0337 family)